MWFSCLNFEVLIALSSTLVSKAFSKDPKKRKEVVKQKKPKHSMSVLHTEPSLVWVTLPSTILEEPSRETQVLTSEGFRPQPQTQVSVSVLSLSLTQGHFEAEIISIPASAHLSPVTDSSHATPVRQVRALVWEPMRGQEGWNQWNYRGKKTVRTVGEL